MEDNKNEITFDGGYGRDGNIWVDNGKCDSCHKEAKVLCVDASEGEYSKGEICLDCIKSLYRSTDV